MRDDNHPTQWERLKSYVTAEADNFGNKALQDRWDKGYWRAMEVVKKWMEEIESADRSREAE